MVNRVFYMINTIITDTIWSMLGLISMNLVAQFLVFPYWNHALGSEAYGNIVYLMAIMNILAVSVGSGVNYARMRRSSDKETLNMPYIVLMTVGSVVSIFILLFLYAAGHLKIEKMEFVFFCILTVATMWRYYADVEYRLSINYKGCCIYYLIIGTGYLAGIVLFKETGLWTLALLPGEIVGLLFVLWRGSIFRKDKHKAEDFEPILHLSMLLIGTNILSHLIFNGDRIILQFFVGSTAVSIYYIASLFGKTMTLITTPLNGVLMGHLAKYEGNLTRKLMNWITALSLAAIVVATVVCCLVSVLILPFLYPADYEEVSKYLMLANAAQVLYFVGNVLVASVLLRFTSVRNQIIVNVIHGLLFVVVCIPAAQAYGISGFCWGCLSVNLIRYVICSIMGYFSTGRTAYENR